MSTGYARLNENVTNGKADNHEGIDFYRPVEKSDKSKPLWGENQWPDIPGFREKYEAWVEKMKKLGMIVMEAYVSSCAYDCLFTKDGWCDIGCHLVWVCPARNGQIFAQRSMIVSGLCVLSVGREYLPLCPDHIDLQVTLRIPAASRRSRRLLLWRTQVRTISCHHPQKLLIDLVSRDYGCLT